MRAVVTGAEVKTGVWRMSPGGGRSLIQEVITTESRDARKGQYSRAGIKPHPNSQEEKGHGENGRWADAEEKTKTHDDNAKGDEDDFGLVGWIKTPSQPYNSLDTANRQ